VVVLVVPVAPGDAGAVAGAGGAEHLRVLTGALQVGQPEVGQPEDGQLTGVVPPLVGPAATKRPKPGPEVGPETPMWL
jgi:hypothetical protein